MMGHGMQCCFSFYTHALKQTNPEPPPVSDQSVVYYCQSQIVRKRKKKVLGH